MRPLNSNSACSIISNENSGVWKAFNCILDFAHICKHHTSVIFLCAELPSVSVNSSKLDTLINTLIATGLWCILTSSLISCALIQVCNIPLRAEAVKWEYFTLRFLFSHVPNVAVKKIENYPADRWCCSAKFEPLSQFWPSSTSWRGHAHQPKQGYVPQLLCPSLRWLAFVSFVSYVLAVATTAKTYLPKPLNTRNPLWIWFIIYTSGGRFSTDPLWGHIQSCILGDGAAWSVLMSWLKFDSLRQQIWQLSAETSFSHTGIPLWGRA